MSRTASGISREGWATMSFKIPSGIYRGFKAACVKEGISYPQAIISVMNAISNGDIKMSLNKAIAENQYKDALTAVKIMGDFDIYRVKLESYGGELINPTPLENKDF